MTKLEEVALSIWHERAKHFGEPPRPFVKDERDRPREERHCARRMDSDL